MKKAVIIRTTGNELANQLWNYASIYAYTLERGIKLSNPSFFEYGKYFNMQATQNVLFNILFFLPFRNYTKRKTSLKRRIWRKFYKLYSKIIIKYAGEQVVTTNDRDPAPYYLPPSTIINNQILDIEKKYNIIYFNGWLFRNPVGLKKYWKEIREYFEPRNDIKKMINSNIKTLREKYSNLIGVHIRQGDYKNWRGGKYFIEQKRVRKILEEYLKTTKKNYKKICFVITSDEKIDSEIFDGLNIFISNGNAVNDIFLLSKTDTVIGSNSTFGPFASYYGNIPFIVMTNTNIDWDYYKNKLEYFENKYSNFVFY